MCQSCMTTKAGLWPAQSEALDRLDGSYERLDVYDIGSPEGTVMLHGHRVTEGTIVTMIALLESDGQIHYDVDGLNQFYWLEDIEKGRWPRIRRRRNARSLSVLAAGSPPLRNPA